MALPTPTGGQSRLWITATDLPPKGTLPPEAEEKGPAEASTVETKAQVQAQAGAQALQ